MQQQIKCRFEFTLASYEKINYSNLISSYLALNGSNSFLLFWLSFHCLLYIAVHLNKNGKCNIGFKTRRIIMASISSNAFAYSLSIIS
uniref:SFRICE041931.2 n=1 Tax=Spodoptera frugiperda TaxID=7108 RepID=A0A2H1VHY2_SPOFR